jgi:hypothetical protein
VLKSAQVMPIVIPINLGENMSAQEPRGQELINRYKNNYHISHDIEIAAGELDRET